MSSGYSSEIEYCTGCDEQFDSVTTCSICVEEAFCDECLPCSMTKINGKLVCNECVEVMD